MSKKTLASLCQITLCPIRRWFFMRALGAYEAAILNAKGINKQGRKRPTILALSRQNLPNQAGTSREGVLKGAYIVYGGEAKPDAIIMSTGVAPRRS
jgi:transketolase